MRKVYNYIAKLNKKQKAALCILLIAIYLGSYIILSMRGEYQMTMSGKRRYFGWLAMMDMCKWTPYGVTCEVYIGPTGEKEIGRLNFLGALYSPLVWIDRTYIHKNTTVGGQ